MSVPATTMYADFQGLANLKSEVRSAPGENLEEVAAQFESIFVQMMLKSMRDATVEGGVFDSEQLKTYQQMFDQQLSLDMSRQGGLGLAKILVEQLGEQHSPEADNPHIPPTASAPVMQMEAGIATQIHATPAPGPVPTTEKMTGSTTGTTAVSSPAATDFAPSTPEEFIRGVWEHAAAAASELGVDPAVLVAQSALETGWGRKVIKNVEGETSYNLFGIKAGSEWQGKSATVKTLEFRDGVAAMERAAFRAYESLSGAFGDYVGLLKHSPRYQDALAAAADGRAYLEELQSAGYATDPQYADKIMGILERENYASVIEELKISPGLSLSG